MSKAFYAMKFRMIKMIATSFMKYLEIYLMTILPDTFRATSIPSLNYVKPEILACATYLDDPPTFARWTTKVTLDNIEFTALLDTGASADLMRPDVADRLKLHRHQCATLEHFIS
jgi:hypothetical protein